MSKPPAFQFYYDRFISSTSLWDDAQVGQYIRLLAAQANKGYVTAKELARVTDDPEVQAKFDEVESGKFANKVLTEVLKQRDDYSESRKRNRQAREDAAKSNTDNTHEATHVVTHVEDMSPTTTTTTTTTTLNTLPTTTPTKKIAANADEYFLDRESVIKELNELTGREFDPHANYFRKDLNARIKEHGVEDLLDMVRFIVFKRKGSEFEQWLKPDTMFRLSKCSAYMADMKHYRKHGIIPRKDAQPKASPNANLMQEVQESLKRKFSAA